MDESKAVQISVEAGVMTIRLNRVEKKNALTHAMYETLNAAFSAAESDPSVKVIAVLGDRQVFCAGNDLEDFMAKPPLDDSAPVGHFLKSIARTPKPIIAGVCGPAVGVGTTMLMHFDVVYAADNAKFALSFASLGLCPEAASSLLFARIAGLRRASEKLLFGEPFGAEEAFEMGLVNQVLSVDALEAHVLQRAHTLAALPTPSILETKRLLKKADAALVEERMQEESEMFRKLLLSPAAREAFQAFFEKRKPDFSKIV